MPAAQAAKEKMTPVFSLAASAAWPSAAENAQTNPPLRPAPSQHRINFAQTNPTPTWLTPNSHPDHQLPTAVLYRGLGSAISNTATGFQAPLYDDRVRPRCTSKERDAETGLDWFEARYFSGPQGRFTSPDDPLEDQDASDPQSWNLYGYVRNNPLRYLDPTGHDCITANNQTESSVSVTITSGTCNGNVGAYVPGTVDTKSLTYNGTSIGYAYTPDAAGALTSGGTVNLGPAPRDALSPFAQGVIGQVGIWTTDRSIFSGPTPYVATLLQMIEGGGAREEIEPIEPSTGRNVPQSLKEQLAMEQVKSNPAAGKELKNIKMNDPRWPASQGWVKMEQKVNGVTVHYVRNTNTGAVADFKFK